MDFLSFFRREQPSKDVAKSRLKFVLVQDRINCSPQMMEMMKTDILKVISNYVDIDEDNLDIQITQTPKEDGSLPVLYANIPIKSLRKVR